MGPLALLVLRITQRCNLACRYCYAAGEGETAEEDMTAEMAIRAVEEAVSYTHLDVYKRQPRRAQRETAVRSF